MNKPFFAKRLIDSRSAGGLQFLGFVSLFVLFMVHLQPASLPYGALIETSLVLLVILLLLVTFTKTLPRALRKAEKSALTKTQRLWFTIHSTITGLGMVLLSVWMFALVSQIPFESPDWARYESSLHAGVMMAIASFAMGLRRVYFWYKILDLTPGRMVFFLYGVASTVGALLLILPISLQPEISVSVIDGLFVSVSSLTLTGLTPLSVASTFTMFGQLVILTLVQLGGLGIVVLTVGIVALTQQRLSVSMTVLSQNELYDMPNLGSIRSFVAKVVGITLAMELLGGILMYFSLPADLPNRLFHTLFHAVTAFCNAGLSTFEGNLNHPNIAVFQGIVVFLVFFANFGFLVLVELLDLVRGKIKKMSNDAILSASVGIVFSLLGIAGFFLSETYSRPEAQDWLTRLGHSIYYALAGKTAGFNVSNLEELSSGALLIESFMMVLGGGSLATAGGIKTSTFGVLLVAAWSLFRGHKWMQFRRTEIPQMVLQKSVAILMLYFVALFVAIFIVESIEHLDPMAVTFELVSAISTVGLSLGVTEQVGTASKLIMILLMLAGRLGFVSIVYVGIGRQRVQKFRYSKDRYFVG